MLRARALALLLSIPCLASAEDPATGLSLAAHAGWGMPDGRVRLVRGTRKVVTTGTDDAPGWGVGLGYPFGPRWSASLDFSRFVFRHFHRSDFTNGQSLETQLDLPYDELLAGVDLHLTPRRRVELTLGLRFGWAWYGSDIRVQGEAVVPEDLSTVNETTFVFVPEGYAAAGLQIAAAVPLARRLSLVPRLAFTLTPLRARLRDDPEDPEPGPDINNSFSPFVVSVGLAWRF